MRFDSPVTRDGYAWWYIDALSDDGKHGLALIAFVGSVFSPYYAAARRRGRGDPEQHCALNVALYGPHRRWTMTERGRSALVRDADHLAIGPSRLQFDGSRLVVEIDEIAVPLPRRVRGRVTVRIDTPGATVFRLDAAGLHRWWPIAPTARINVAFDKPHLSWSGHAYLDMNAGSVPLERSFRSWQWSRATGVDETTILYDTIERDGAASNLSLHIAKDGSLREGAPTASVELARTGWRVARSMRVEPGTSVSVARTLEDAPFYARSLLETERDGERTLVVHESLSLDRFDQRWVQMLLPFRMPRRVF